MIRFALRDGDRFCCPTCFSVVAGVGLVTYETHWEAEPSPDQPPCLHRPDYQVAEEYGLRPETEAERQARCEEPSCALARRARARVTRLRVERVTLAAGGDVVRQRNAERDGVECWGQPRRPRRQRKSVRSARRWLYGADVAGGGMEWDEERLRTDYDPAVPIGSDTWCPACGLRVRLRNPLDA